MIKALIFAVLLFGAVYGGDDAPKDSRQKRLLFYDEDGNLVKAQFNPYIQNLRINAGHLPYYGSFINPFLGFLKELGNSLAAITIPISNKVVQQMQNNPLYQNTLVIATKKEPMVVPHPLCMGKRTQIPSPALCNNYLNCWDGWAVEQECPTGLLFSNQGFCDFSDNVNCESRKLSPQPLTEPQCNKDFDSFRNQKNCNEFFVCVGREPVRFKCPADLAYNQILGVCDYPTRVDCGSSPLFDLPIPELEKPELPELPIEATTPALPVTIPGGVADIIPTPKPAEIRPLPPFNTLDNPNRWSSTHVAMSRQDAIRLLQAENSKPAPSK